MEDLTKPTQNKGKRAGFAAIVLVLAGLVLMVICISNGCRAEGRQLEFVGTPVSLGSGVTDALDEEGKSIALTTRAGSAPGQESAFCSFAAAGDRTITIVHEGQRSVLQVRVLSRGWFVAGAAGVLLVLLGIPYLLRVGESTVDAKGNPIGPWYYMLSEPKGGYSLARVQLLVWFIPAILIYGGLSLALTRFAPLDGTIAVLLGLAGATTLLGTAANPSKATSEAGGEVEPPALADLVTDWYEHGDLSRYQYLILSVIGAATLLAAFLKDFIIPEIPQQFLYVVGASQATYVGTKAVKTSKTDA